MSIIKTYTTELENGIINIDVKVENYKVWLTQGQLAELLNCSVVNISQHINNIFKEDELEEKSVIQYFLITATDGKNYRVKHYNLDMIISLGFRVNSKEAVKFRKWANAIIKELLTTGRVDLENNHQYKLPKTYSEALRELADLNEAKELAEEAKQIAESKLSTEIENHGKTIITLEETKQVVIEQKPFAEYGKTVATSSDNVLIGDVAKNSGLIGRNNLFKLLRAKEVLCKNNLPRQQYIDQGYFEVYESIIKSPKGDINKFTTEVTGKGQIWLTKKIKEWLSENNTPKN